MTVIAAVDDDDATPKVVREAVRLANAYDVDLHVVHVVDRDQFVASEMQSMHETDTPIPIEDIREAAADVAAEAAEGVDRAFDPVGLVGDPADRVTAYAEDVGAEYIVVDGRKRSPIGKAVFSSVTQDILFKAECPVVTVLHQPSE